MELLDYLMEQAQSSPLLPGSNSIGQLKRDLFKTIVLSYPAGTMIPHSEFVKALNYTSVSGFWATRKRLETSGEIVRLGEANSKAAYKVLVQPNQYRAERGLPEPLPVKRHDKPVINLEDDKVMEESMDVKKYTFSELEQLAMKYQFYFDPSSSDISKFLTAIKGGVIE
jgi:hypothetical protein